MLLSKISGTNNSIYQERYLTISVHKKNIDEARTYFARVGTDIITHLAKLSSIGEELDAEQRLQIFRDFFKADVPQSFPFDMKAFAKKDTASKTGSARTRWNSITTISSWASSTAESFLWKITPAM